MKRRRTLLETNLLKCGYLLSHKTYVGKTRDKVGSYIYMKENNFVVYQVSLDWTRNIIETYSFTTKEEMVYTWGIIESLQIINSKFHQELNEIYNFEQKCARELPCEPRFEENDDRIDDYMFDEVNSGD